MTALIPRQHGTLGQSGNVILRDPELQLDPRVQRLWVVEWAFAAFVCAAVTTALAVPLALAEEGLAALVAAAVGGGATLLVAVFAVVQPRLGYRRFRYEITDLGLYVARGRLFRQWQVVPHARVQTVDTKRGPLERAFGLVSVAVTTAAAKGGTDIPGLDPRVADALVDELARRAGIDEGT
ncbi:MAG: PH domain-containing protein [Gaiellaceae bacterium]